MVKKEKGPTNNEGIRHKRHGRLADMSNPLLQAKTSGGGVNIEELLREIRQKKQPTPSKRGFNS